MSIPRVYDPAECDEQGVPLDWERCRCRDYAAANDTTCPFCLDEGSLRAYVLKECWYRTVRARRANENHTAAEWEQLETADRAERPIRCNGCGHPRSEGTWEDPHTVLAHCLGYVETRERGRKAIMRGVEPLATAGASQHYSPCDEGCRHDCKAVRIRAQGREPVPSATFVLDYLREARSHDPEASTEASWRPVDIRTLGWPHDLRPEKLAVLCLRCYAERTKTL